MDTSKPLEGPFEALPSDALRLLRTFDGQKVRFLIVDVTLNESVRNESRVRVRGHSCGHRRRRATWARPSCCNY